MLIIRYPVSTNTCMEYPVYTYYPFLSLHYCNVWVLKRQSVSFLPLDDIAEAYNLIKDLEPTTPQEYILKGVVNAALGQEQGSVSESFWQKINIFGITLWRKNLIICENHCIFNEFAERASQDSATIYLDRVRISQWMW